MALTGYLVNQGHSTVCAPDAAAAIVALGGRFPYVAGSQPSLCNLDTVVFSAPNIFNNSVTCHDLTGNASWNYTHPLKLVMCDPADTLGTNAAMFADGMAMGWGVVAAMAAALAVIFLKNALVVR